MKAARTAGLLLLFTVMGAEARAQSSDALAQGVRVRLVPPAGKSMTGTILTVSADSITLNASSPGGPPRTMPMAAFRRIDVSRGRSRMKGAMQKGLIGFAAAGIAGAMLGAFGDSGCDPDEFCLEIFSREEAALFGGVVFGTLGFAFGAAVGASMGAERWETLPGRRP